MLPMNGLVPISICLAVCAIASITDWRSWRIPNWLTLPALALGLGLGVFDGGQGLLAALVGALVCGLTPLILCALGAMGGGDLKLLMSMGALLGAKLGLTAQLYAFAAASVWGMGAWMVRGQSWTACQRLWSMVLRRPAVREGHRRLETQLRFAPSALVGTLGALMSLLGFP